MESTSSLQAPRPEIGSRPAVVLVVEDEDIVRQFAVETLREAGFEVLEAPSSDEALRLLEQRRDVKVMVSDVRMPGPVNGYFLARKVRDRWPYVEIMLVSGYAAPARQELHLDCEFLAKPYEGEDLVRRVQGLTRRGM